jgi:hypothetical protein
MNAISSLSSFSFRSGQGAALPSAQQAQAQRGTFNASNSGAGTLRGNGNVTGNATGTNAARGGNANSASSTFCPTCVGGSGGAARGGATSSSSFCPTCNQAGGRQSRATNNFNANTNARVGATQTGAAQAGSAHNHQGGRVCVGCAYQGR